jgi:hypothetical protein
MVPIRLNCGNDPELRLPATDDSMDVFALATVIARECDTNPAVVEDRGHAVGHDTQVDFIASYFAHTWR